MSFNPGLTTVSAGTFSNSTCTTENDLILNALKKPAIQEAMDFTNQRPLMTLLTSGIVEPYGVKDAALIRTKMPLIDASKKIADNSYRYSVMGRINKESEIIAQIGATQADGTFQLLMKDNLLYDGFNALFHAADFTARVQGNPTGGPGNYTYTFRTMDGRLFDWTTHVAGQTGAKTCMGVYTSYSEASLQGYGRPVYPDTFVVHMTIQRGAAKITGDAGSDIRWFQYNDLNGKGIGSEWMWEEVYQERANMTIQNEYQKWFGISSMKNTDGTVKSVAPIDPTTGMPIVAGDGVIPQIAGGNDFTASGSDGMPTLDDFGDMVQSILTGASNTYNGLNLVCVTGVEGYRHIQTIAPLLTAAQSTTYFRTLGGTEAVKGGIKIDAGLEFTTLNFFGNSVTFVMHPRWNDNRTFTLQNSFGKYVQPSTFYFLTIEEMGYGKKNIEIFAKGKGGIDRSYIMTPFFGMTGRNNERTTSSQDVDKIEFLMQDLIKVDRPNLCGILRPSA